MKNTIVSAKSILAVRRTARVLLVPFLMVALTLTVGCDGRGGKGGGGSKEPSISVAVSPNSAALDFGQAQTSTTTVTKTATALSIITISPALTVHAPASGIGMVNRAYSDKSISTRGGSGAKTFAIASGSLPTGLVLSASTGAISGTPTTAGIFMFTVSVTDSATTPVTITTPIIYTDIIPAGIVVSISNRSSTVESGQAD